MLICFAHVKTMYNIEIQSNTPYFASVVYVIENQTQMKYYLAKADMYIKRFVALNGKD